MKRIFSVLGQVFRKSILLLGLVGLISLSGLFIFIDQPSYAASRVTPEEEFQRAKSSQSPEVRGEAYEEATKEAKSLRDEQKAYEENLAGYRGQNSGGGLVEGAEGLVEKVTGKS